MSTKYELLQGDRRRSRRDSITADRWAWGPQSWQNGGSRILVIGLLAALLLVSSCARMETAEPTPEGQTFVGESKEFGKGELHTWARLDPGGNPISVGVTFTEGMLSGLSGSHTEYSLEMPEEAVTTLFTHVLFDWGFGHDPWMYQVPHFDFAFYIIPELERLPIRQGPSTMEFEPQYLPQDYTRPAPLSFMSRGVYWNDAEAPEWNGQDFTATLFYVSYEGQMISIGSGVTKAFLETEPDVTYEIKQPQAYQRSGYYPTEYSVRYDPDRGEYTVALEGFAAR
jgi:Hypothetical protein TTHB210